MKKCKFQYKKLKHSLDTCIKSRTKPKPWTRSDTLGQTYSEKEKKNWKKSKIRSQNDRFKRRKKKELKKVKMEKGNKSPD